MTEGIEIIEAVLIGIASSIVASTVFMLSLSRMRPKIDIAPVIAKDIARNEKTFYVIKVLNRTKRDVVNVKAELRLMTHKEVKKGGAFITQDIQLTKPEILAIKGFDKKDKSFSYRFSTYEDLEEKWNNNTTSYLSFRIYAVDSFSGFGKVFTKRFMSKEKSLVEGKFASGESFEIC